MRTFVLLFAFVFAVAAPGVALAHPTVFILLSAQEALSCGIVSEVLPPDELLPRAHAIARDIAEHTAPVAVSITRRLLWRQWMEPDPAAAKAREDRLFYWIGQHPDVAEGVNAFLDKRPPQWQGKASQDGLPPELAASLALEPEP